jgi:spore coat protein CotH
MRAGHKLKERFLAAPAFKQRYEAAYRDLYRKLYADGTAARLVDEIAATLRRVDGMDGSMVDLDARALANRIQSRIVTLAQHPVITGT